MTYTANHHLPQWVEADRVRMEDFNGAMGQLEKSLNAESAARSGDKANLQAQINRKAEQTAVDAVNATQARDKAALQNRIDSLAASVGSKGKTCRIMFGSYTGTGTGGVGTPNVLVTGFYPLLVVVMRHTDTPSTTYLPNVNIRPHEAYTIPTFSGTGYCKWGNDRVSFTVKENVNAEYVKFNVAGNTYYYMALGYDL